MMTTPTTSQNRKKHNNTKSKAWCRQILNKQDPTYCMYSLTYKLPGHCLLCQKKTTLNIVNGSNHSKHDKLWNWWEVHILFHFFVNRKLKSDFLIMPLTVYGA